MINEGYGTINNDCVDTSLTIESVKAPVTAFVKLLLRFIEREWMELGLL